MKKTANAWLEVMAKEMGRNHDVVPEGWVSIADICKQLKMSVGEAETFARRGIREGVMEKKKFWISTGAGCRQVWHYNKVKK